MNEVSKLINFNKKMFIIILILATFFLGGILYKYYPEGNSLPKIYRIAIDETWYPLNLFNKEEYITAFSEELTLAVASQHHLPIQFIQVESENLFTGLDMGEYEAVLSSLLVLEENGNNYAVLSLEVIEENNENYIFTNSYYLIGPVLVVPLSSHIKSLKDLSGKIIGIVNESKPISSLLKDIPINFIFYEYNKRSQLAEDVINNVIDGMILDMIPAYETAKFYRNQLKIASIPLTREGLRLIAKDTPESKRLIDQFNEGLKTDKKNGTYDRLLAKWGLFNPEKL